MFDLTGKIALVTGASSGIGHASARLLAKQGASVVVAARRIEKLEELVSQIKSAGGKGLAVKMDVTQKQEIDDAVKKAVEAYGRLDILLNNAGVVESSPFLELTEQSWDKVLDTNLKGYFLVAQKAAKEMAKNKWGRIVNIASIAMGGQGVGFAGIAHYCASKGGVVAFTEALADELAPMGIIVNCIAPGIIQTEMTKSTDPQALNAILSKVPLKREGKPEEIASAVIYLSSDEASYTTGATLVVDGGWLSQ